MTDRVLVVDDEPDLLELVRFHLAQAGFEVETARDGRQGLEAIRRRRPDLVVLDWMLPDLSAPRSAARCAPTRSCATCPSCS
jgi:DNA-binding response OmpR family regulator